MAHELAQFLQALHTMNRAEVLRLVRLAGLVVADDEDFTLRLKEFEEAIRAYQEAQHADE